MPNYVYRCKCGKETTVTCKMSDYSHTIQCECGETAERKVDDLICGLSIDNTGTFYRKVN